MDALGRSWWRNLKWVYNNSITIMVFPKWGAFICNFDKNDFLSMEKLYNISCRVDIIILTWLFSDLKRNKTRIIQ